MRLVDDGTWVDCEIERRGSKDAKGGWQALDRLLDLMGFPSGILLCAEDRTRHDMTTRSEGGREIVVECCWLLIVHHPSL